MKAYSILKRELAYGDYVLFTAWADEMRNKYREVTKENNHLKKELGNALKLVLTGEETRSYESEFYLDGADNFLGEVEDNKRYIDV